MLQFYYTVYYTYTTHMISFAYKIKGNLRKNHLMPGQTELIAVVSQRRPVYGTAMLGARREQKCGPSASPGGLG